MQNSYIFSISLKSSSIHEGSTPSQSSKHSADPPLSHDEPSPPHTPQSSSTAVPSQIPAQSSPAIPSQIPAQSSTALPSQTPAQS